MTNPLFRIKICGVTTIADALQIAAAGADAIGLNFYPRSARYVEVAMAREIVAALPAGVLPVGVFVNASTATIRQTVRDVGLRAIQLHGDETPKQLAELAPLPTIRAFRLGPTGEICLIAAGPQAGHAAEMVTTYLAAAREQRANIEMLLIDRASGQQYGGTGETVDWQHAGELMTRVPSPPLALAGGLTADNVGAAIERVRPAAVDTASGVESTPGRKDPARVVAFVNAARQGLDRLRS